MSVLDLQLRQRLQKYELQLLTARRLARFRRAQQLASGEKPLSDAELEARRAAMVERVAHELYETIIFTGSDNPMVDTIRERLGQQVGGEVRFTYPPGEESVRILRESPEGVRSTSKEEQAKVLQDLWPVTLKTVQESML